MQNLKYILFAFVGSLMLTACGPATNITATWNNPDLNVDAFENVLVTAMVSDVAARQLLEDELALQLRAKGAQVTQGMNLFPPELRDEKMGNEEELLNAINEKKFDGIITVTLIDKDTDTRYVPGNYAYAPVSRFGYYGNFWGYYNTWYPAVYDPGYYNTTRQYFLETNLYDATTEKLVWSAQSETINPGSVENFSEDYSKRITKKLIEEKLVSANGMAAN